MIESKRMVRVVQRDLASTYVLCPFDPLVTNFKLEREVGGVRIYWNVRKDES